ncbi:hypothetical protein [Streptomyces sp. T028]|uniref:hypothetical protein n=1 Tax=Streptomyces sp. T028 TaxID=3394379 RepID=UPI003A86DDDE
MSEQTTPVRSLTCKNRVGLVLAGTLGLLDVTFAFTIPEGDADTPGPPVGIVVADAVLGLITVIAVVYTWRTADRTGSRAVAGSRVLSVITALPAFYVNGVPAGIVTGTSAFVIVNVVAVAFVLSRPAPEPAAP